MLHSAILLLCHYTDFFHPDKNLLKSFPQLTPFFYVWFGLSLSKLKSVQIICKFLHYLLRKKSFLIKLNIMTTGINHSLSFLGRMRILAIVLLAVAGVGAVAALLVFDEQIVSADEDYNELSGWAWSETVGWISLNCKDEEVCDDIDYQVRVDSDGYLSGYAWANPRDEEAGTDNIGWLSFNVKSGDCPHEQVDGMISDDCLPRIEEDGSIVGWARFLSGTLEDDDGWDGWLHLGGGDEVKYGARVNTEFDEDSLAWGDNVIGWVGFEADYDANILGDIRGRRSSEDYEWSDSEVRIRPENDIQLQWRLPATFGREVKGDVDNSDYKDEEAEDRWDEKGLDSTGDSWSETYKESKILETVTFKMIDDQDEYVLEIDSEDEDPAQVSFRVTVVEPQKPTCQKNEDEQKMEAENRGGYLESTDDFNYSWHYEYSDENIEGSISGGSGEGDELSFSDLLQTLYDEYDDFELDEIDVENLEVSVSVIDTYDQMESDPEECDDFEWGDFYDILQEEF